MTEAAPNVVHYEVTDQVATITLDSPANRNALSRALVSGLSDALTAAEADDTVRVVLLRSSGRVFCSGADLSEATTVPMEQGAAAIVALQRHIVALDIPVVASVAGPVRAGGIGIVAACDVVVAAQEANFSLTEVKLGLAAAVISLTVHARMNPRASSWTTLSGATFTGAQAAAYGLVSEVVPGDDLDARVAAVCAEIATGNPQGLRESKALLNRDLLARIDELGPQMVTTSARLFGSDTARAAMMAWLTRPR